MKGIAVVGVLSISLLFSGCKSFEDLVETNDLAAVSKKIQGNPLVVNQVTERPSILLQAATPIFYANSTQMLDLLHGAGAAINIPAIDKRGRKVTILCYEIFKQRNQLVDWLVEKGCDVNEAGAGGQTPILYAVSGDNVVGVNVLLAHGANPNCANNSGDTPLALAFTRGLDDVAKALLDGGADPYYRESCALVALQKERIAHPRYRQFEKCRSLVEPYLKSGDDLPPAMSSVEPPIPTP